MKNLLDRDLSFVELKKNLKRLRRKNNSKFILLMSMSILILIGVIILIVMKLRKNYECEYDDFYDNDDSYYTGTHHFED